MTPDVMPETIDDEGLLAQAAALAGSIVAIIKHSGARGTRQEFAALVSALEAAPARAPANPYLPLLLTAETRTQIAGFAQRYTDVPKQTEVNDFKLAALNRCGQAAEWLAAHVAPAQADEVKQAIVDACRQVAAESKEGGLLAFGVDPVDAFEASVIEEIGRALRWADATSPPAA
jgi:hypothetical protein